MSAFDLVSDGVEMLIFWISIYAVLRFLKGTRGLGILKGAIVYVLILYVLSQVLFRRFDVELARLNFVIEYLFTVGLIAFVIIFQPELRRALTRLGEKPFSWLSGREVAKSLSPIAEAAGRLSRRRIGALIVIEREVGISGIVESGVPLSAEVTAPLLESIFYPNAPLHDGAVVVRGDRVVAACCILPLSDNPVLGADVGTRHRAAVGLSEETDAIVVVVSEQTGRISVAYHGVIQSVRDTRELEGTVNRLLDGGELEGAPAAGSGVLEADRPASLGGARDRAGAADTVTRTAILARREPKRGEGSGVRENREARDTKARDTLDETQLDLKKRSGTSGSSRAREA